MKKTIARIGARATALMPLLLWGSLALAQTTTDLGTTTGTTGSTTPGTPNTGVGGDVATMLLVLGVSAAVAVVGAVYLARAGRISG